MPGAVPFRIVDVARAIKGARRGGMEPARAEIDPATGRIVIFAAAAKAEPQNDFDKWMERHADTAEGH